MSAIETVLVDIRSLFMATKMASVREITLKIDKQPGTFYQRDVVTLDILYEEIDEEKSLSGSQKSLTRTDKSDLEPIKE